MDREHMAKATTNTKKPEQKELPGWSEATKDIEANESYHQKFELGDKHQRVTSVFVIDDDEPRTFEAPDKFKSKTDSKGNIVGTPVMTLFASVAVRVMSHSIDDKPSPIADGGEMRSLIVRVDDTSSLARELKKVEGQTNGMKGVKCRLTTRFYPGKGGPKTKGFTLEVLESPNTETG
jgi:hypothetical protein